MKVGKNIREWIAAALFVVGAVLFISSFRVSLPSGDTTGAARRVERVLNRRMALLDTYAGQARAQDPAQWMTLEGLPRDMVVYRYCRDTLQSWSHAFPIANDNINQRVYVPFLADPRVGAESPLLQAEDSVSFVCMGTHWYLLKSYGDAAVRVIAGVEVMDDLPMGGASRVNPRLRLSRRYSIRPLTTGGGTAVTVQGRPQFKVLCETLTMSRDASPLLWLALFLVLAAFLLYLSAERSRSSLSVLKGLRFLSTDQTTVTSLRAAATWASRWETPLALSLL